MTQHATLLAVGQIARTVSDTNVSQAWYRDVLGLNHLYTFGSMAFFQIGETRLMLSGDAGKAEPESIFYLKTEDIEAEYNRLVEKGVRFKSAPHKIHQHEDGSEEWMAFFIDPDDRPIGLMSTVQPQE